VPPPPPSRDGPYDTSPWRYSAFGDFDGDRQALALLIVLLNVFYFSAAWLMGDLMATRRRREELLEAQGAELAEARAEIAQRAVDAERVRIARELHDVVAHHVSVMGVQAGAARRILDRSPNRAATALGAKPPGHQMFAPPLNAAPRRPITCRPPSTGVGQARAGDQPLGRPQFIPLGTTVTPGIRRVQAMLELDDLTRRYGDVVALDGVTFTVSPGEIVGFVGRNGAGKTTAMRIALGLTEPDRGEIRWNGSRPDQTTRAIEFGYLPEERGLYPKMRIVDQLRFLGRLSGLAPRPAVEAADAWLERLGLADRAADTLDTLSLGNQQRVQLAAAVLHQPDLLVLDEPFSGLDPIGVDLMAEALGEEVGRGAAVLFSSHQLDLVERLCESVAVIDAGRLVAHGRTDELRAARSGRRYEIEVRGAIDPDWADGVAGASVLERSDTSVVVELAEDTDDQRLLDAARAAGTVRRFGPVTASLAELYREAVPA
jgi:ABC-2 type transport system ATP-binding protein